MYASAEGLQTGDVIKLDLNDFKSLARHASIVGLFKQFDESETFNHDLWALLNKPCDMVHDDSQKRKFDTNILLCPLRGLKSALKEKILRGYLHQVEVENPRDFFLKEFRVFQIKIIKKKTQAASNEKKKHAAEAAADAIIQKLSEITIGVSKDDTSPELFASTLRQIAEENAAISSELEDFFSSEKWSGYSERYEEALSNQNRLRLGKSGVKNLAKLCLNQMDSQGLFFFEPNIKISHKATDVAFVIKLDEMISFKVKTDMVQSGKIVSFLKDKRQISLTENFSDRLLNIMGNYYSKIGTADVALSPVLNLYKDLDDTEITFDENHLVET